ncbi:MAG: fibronectin type III domain-containing protein [Flavobacteriales bacterium]
MATLILYSVKIGLEGLNTIQTVERARNHVSNMGGNINFLTPIPTLLAVTAAADAAEAADLVYENNHGRLDLLARNQRTRELRELIKDLGGYVQAVCGGDAEKITSAAFGVRALPSPPELMPAPQNLRATPTDMPREIKLRWSGVRHHKSYVIYWCIGDPLVEANWQMLTIITKNFFLHTGLDRKNTYSYRVVAVGAAGAGPASDIAVTQPR